MTSLMSWSVSRRHRLKLCGGNADVVTQSAHTDVIQVVSHRDGASQTMYYASAKLAYCMPIDPYSLIVGAKRYHAVRGAVIAMDFIRDRKQRNVLQVSKAASRSNISNLPIEVIDAIAVELLAADNHDARCDCWVKFPDCWEAECDCVEDMQHTCAPSRDDCYCYDRFVDEHCIYDCASMAYVFESYDENYEHAQDLEYRLATPQRNRSKRSSQTEIWAAVSAAKADVLDL